MNETNINGSVLRTLNLLSGKCTIAGLAFVCIDNDRLTKSLDYLQKNDYVRKLGDSVILTKKGIKVLCGFIHDDSIEV